MRLGRRGDRAFLCRALVAQYVEELEPHTVLEAPEEAAATFEAEQRTWIAIRLVDPKGRPVPGERR